MNYTELLHKTIHGCATVKIHIKLYDEWFYRDMIFDKVREIIAMDNMIISDFFYDEKDVFQIYLEKNATT